MGIERLYQADYVADFPACNHSEHNLNLPAAAVPVNARDTISLLIQLLNQWQGVSFGDDPYQHNAQAELLGNGDAYIIAHRKAACIRNIAGRIGQIRHDLTIAKSQINISKKPTMGARCLSPLDTKITRTVPKLTSAILATKMRRGSTNQVYNPPDETKTPLILLSPNMLAVNAPKRFLCGCYGFIHILRQSL